MPLSALHVVQLIAFAFLLATGNILFKLTANHTQTITDASGFLHLLYSPYFWGAGFLYFGATVLWIFILQQVPLSRAYPFAALGFVLVPFCSYFIFGESISLRLMAGTVFILIGIYLAALAPS